MHHVYHKSKTNKKFNELDEIVHTCSYMALQLCYPNKFMLDTDYAGLETRVIQIHGISVWCLCATEWAKIIAQLGQYPFEAKEMCFAVVLDLFSLEVNVHNPMALLVQSHQEQFMKLCLRPSIIIIIFTSVQIVCKKVV